TAANARHLFQKDADAISVTFRIDVLLDPLARVDVRNLPYAKRGDAAFDKKVQIGFGRGTLGVVFAMVSPFERACGLAHERSGDHAAYLKFIANLSRRLADRVEALKPESLLVGRDLPDAVGAGIKDRLSRPDVLLAKLDDDFGSASGLVSQHTGK